MKVFNDISQFKASNNIVTIGIFDGVHLGHVEILKRIKTLAADCKGESVVVTLWPHPRFVFQPGNTDLKLLTSLDEKIGLIEKQGINNLVVLPFTLELANITYDRFVTDFLVNGIGARHVVVGFNHHFGKDRKGTFENLQKSAREHGIRSERLDPVIVSGNRISSSGIRHMIEEGRITAANEALGYPYFINGTVVQGNKLGRTLGYPTANIQLNEPDKLLPRNGVYAVRVGVMNREFQGMLNIGIRPTISSQDHSRTVEVNLFDFDADIYHKPITVTFLEWLRVEKKFGSLQELKEQLAIDKEEISKLFRPA
ncbi:MAG TPA: bifunctional riboflavin kinase/FAD synthetase [Bacteroidales bacterium]|nr:bifunctional riboflavin kinase/FAD synthetase [Bacteroidales bacterium]